VTWPGPGAVPTAIALCLGLLIWSLWPVRAVQIVNDTRRQTIARLAVQDPAPLRLSYVHSIYRQPGIEEFAVRRGGLELIRLGSPSAAVLEYYARPEPILPADGAYEIRIAPQHHDRLAVRVGPVGRRTLVYAGHELALHELAGDGDRIALEIVRVPRLALLSSDLTERWT
jgi:uncharacterized protein DUF1850